MLIQETYVNKSEGYRLGETEPYEPYTDDIGELFRELQREYGRCVGKCYVDKKDGSSQAIGWVFQKRQKYDDCNETFLSEVWVTLYKSYDKHTVIDCEYVDL